MAELHLFLDFSGVPEAPSDEAKARLVKELCDMVRSRAAEHGVNVIDAISDQYTSVPAVNNQLTDPAPHWPDDFPFGDE